MDLTDLLRRPEGSPQPSRKAGIDPCQPPLHTQNHICLRNQAAEQALILELVSRGFYEETCLRNQAAEQALIQAG